MSEPIPESIPTSADPRSKRPLKRRALNTPQTAQSEQASQIETLMRDPTREIHLPTQRPPRTAGSLPPPPEIVANVQGSSAGAGSGEFHVYKASRRREYERIRLMQNEVIQEQEDEAWARKQADTKRRDEERTEKNRRRREKKKRANARKETTHQAGGGEGKDGAAGDRMVVDRADETAAAGGGIVAGAEGGNGNGNGEAGGEVQGIIIHDD
ncbi:PRKRIP1 family protein [Aspergillus brunneoviolaceus CBS 621.78]|uniref:Uncharacterized protein n=1 Tax=Aspergillus brunneoviolaceus CBS 621.78 TaxID=1450534 RepID=A0ACD1GIX4_9EURO|nr:hypothetical protein BO95DRAFT_439464 [Aspergillus brunneoviolaceus CBS 621.78]RAH49197.1 hypothetical protein BO95DRAFT_439464 [Aspergillus brunneoviolaceus CBS 621.78]